MGEIYVVSMDRGFNGHPSWVIRDTDKKGVTTEPTLSVGSKMWLVMAEVDDE